MRITRTPAPIPVAAFDPRPAADWSALLDLRDRRWPDRRIVAADLSLGSGRANQLAHDLAAQLGTALPDPLAPAAEGGELIGVGIDAEARGEGAVLTALAFAAIILAALAEEVPTLLAVVLPRNGMPLDREDAWLLRFIAHGAAAADVVLLLIGEARAMPAWALPDWLDCGDGAAAEPAQPFAVPGILTPALAALVECPPGALALPGGCALVPLASRQRAGAEAHDRIAGIAALPSWLRCHAQLEGSNYFVDCDAMAEEAWRQFRAGGTGTALRLIARARDCARARVARAQLEAQLQGMRIAAQHFAEAGAAGTVAPALPPPLRAFLLQSKGWGCTMSGDFAQGRELLAEAVALDAASGRQRLYLLNILALAEARSGRLAEALALEEEIGAANAVDRDDRLHYVNRINTARLHRAAGRLSRARDCYLDAFATVDGARSESDHIYQAACLARLAEEMGEDAHPLWLRSAIHFAAAEAPEAIGPRHAAALVDPGLLPDAEQSERIAAFLLRKLGGGAAAPARAPAAAPSFGAAEDAMGAGLVAVLASGVGLIHGAATIPPAWDGSSHRKLRWHLDSWLRQRAGASLPDGGTWWVDDRFGRSLPGDADGLVDICLRREIGTMLCRGERHSLGPPLAAEMVRSSRLEIGPLVAAIDPIPAGLRIRFRRQLAPLEISDRHGVVAAAREGLCIGEAMAAWDADALAEIRRLEAARVLMLTAHWPAMQEAEVA